MSTATIWDVVWVERRRRSTYLLGFIVLNDVLNSDYERQTQSDAESSEQVIDSTLSGFGDGIDNISDLNSHPGPCCGFQDVDTVLEFVFGIWHYQVDLDVHREILRYTGIRWAYNT